MSMKEISDKQNAKFKRKIGRMTCPFCCKVELFAHVPTETHHYFVVGCQSITCDSSWTISKVNPNTIIHMIQGSRPDGFAAWYKKFYGKKIQTNYV